ncbi:helix-turn-helix domain-containing protein [Nocardioides panaciterrulae]|uniref:Excisionase family DNA binding protein n=1 Tax=Nocardioides panaciterrulae TaxID=661492 RepID=A0A7Y9E331_9ACTN|nr:helix-turn-helix domain-containing protein [Nocardioides panaciterrulae]NYD40040.1 excisionase family DNA binding protein [Nocardioides panaciterrulae]
MPPPTDMTPPQAAEVLGCTAPTVRSLIIDGALRAVATKKGNRTFYAIRREDVDAYVEEHGTFDRRRRGGAADPAAGSSLAGEVRSLRRLVEGRLADSSDAVAEIVALREALQLQRAAMAVLLEADADRAAGVKHMRDAMECFDRADAKRQHAIELLDRVVGSLTLPRTTADLTN